MKNNKKLSAIALSLLMTLSISGCANARDEADKALSAVGNVVDQAAEGAEALKNAAIDSINTLDYAMGNEEGTTIAKMSQYAKDFKEKVKEKVEPIDPDGYIKDALDKEVSIESIKNDFKAVLEPVEYSTTNSYKFFNEYNNNKYDITFTIMHKTDDANIVQRTRVVKDGENIYTNSFAFNQGSTSDFDVFGITFNSKQSGTWYDCNQLMKTKKASENAPKGYRLLEVLMSKGKESNFKASTLNKIVSDDSLTVESFVDSISDTSFVYKDDKLIGVIYTENEITTIVTITVNEYNEDSAKLTTAGTDYTIAE